MAGGSPFLRRRLSTACPLISCLFLMAEPGAALTITELHPHPPAAESNLQFVEVYNDASSVIDLSGWSFSNGIHYVFPERTFLAGRSFLVVAADAEAVRARYGIENVLGNFSGALDPRGESLVIVNDSGVRQVQVSYKDRDRWPSGQDGTGHTLSLRDPYLDPGDGAHWTWSIEPGGTPGRRNFPSRVTGFDETELISLGAAWKYRKGTAAFSAPATDWRQVGFPDAAWLSGPAGIGYGGSDDATVLDDMRDGYVSFAARRTFSLTGQQISAADAFVLSLDYDDVFIAYLNGREFARRGLGAPGEEVPFDLPADDHEAGAP